ncbi:serine protease [Bradyrhizobium sp. CB2312]|uniref:S1 family peptidase n=1 Tax=Bradyrhizobium sp. CB2312 TaxID=3039155 RepID=UPI0024B1B337|nr:serine protease [Bradyrhizobium sp. CB2312]WFU75547.1 serine protease [Bradyrhizobium sp. CB2312]
MFNPVGAALLAILGLGCLPANAACIDPAQLARSSASITRHFDDAERGEHSDVISIRASGWFLSPTSIVTAEHVTRAMKLTTEDWKLLEISARDSHQFVAAPIQQVVGDTTERLTVIELQQAFSNARGVQIRTEPLAPEERIVTLAYPGGHLRVVQGRFVHFGATGGKLAGMALLEMYEGDNRLVIDHGSSGAPVLDCEGRVVAVVSNVLTQSFFWSSREIKMSTAWGMPNVVSVPAGVLSNMKGE